MKQLDYYFWMNSDWAYLGADRLAQMAQEHGVQVHYKPVDLLSVYARTGGIPLFQRSEQRQDYRQQELRRWMARLGIHINVTPKFMCPDASLASRMLIAAEQMGYAVAKLHKDILAAQWCHDQDISEVSVLLDVAGHLGLPGDEMVLRAESSDIALRYQDYTDEAVSAGVFGSPSYVFEREVFWGQDRLDFLGQALANQTLASVQR